MTKSESDLHKVTSNTPPSKEQTSTDDQTTDPILGNSQGAESTKPIVSPGLQSKSSPPKFDTDSDDTGADLPDLTQCERRNIERTQPQHRQWKDILYLTPGNFSSKLRRKDVKQSYNYVKKGFSITKQLPDSQQRKVELLDGDVGSGEPSSQTDRGRTSQQAGSRRKLSFGNIRDRTCSQEEHDRGRGRRGKGRGKS